MRRIFVPLAALALTSVAASAQDTTPAETAPETTEATPEIGETYTKEEIGDWKLRCARAPIGQADPCDLVQLLTTSDGKPMSEVSIQTLAATDEVVADMIIVAPLGLLLPAGIQIAIDGKEGGRVPFLTCNKRSCVAKVGLKPADVQALKAGNVAQLGYVPADRTKQPFALNMSLTGFTAGFDKLPKPAAE